jgi:nucleotide-binding universal stress UspA family protein
VQWPRYPFQCNGRPEAIAHLAGKLKTDLLVIGRKSAAGVLGRLDMTAYSIIRQSPCPVVSV